MNNMIDEQKLRELAEAATPGPWFVVGQPWNPKADFIVAGSPDPHMGRYVADTEDFDGEGQNVQENAEWIAAANPATILALLDELATLRQERTAWRVTAENAEKDAARYRWMLENYARGDGYDAIDQALNDGEPDTQLSPAIDAAIAAATKETP